MTGGFSILLPNAPLVECCFVSLVQSIPRIVFGEVNNNLPVGVKFRAMAVKTLRNMSPNIKKRQESECFAARKTEIGSDRLDHPFNCFVAFKENGSKPLKACMKQIVQVDPSFLWDQDLLKIPLPVDLYLHFFWRRFGEHGIHWVSRSKPCRSQFIFFCQKKWSRNFWQVHFLDILFIPTTNEFYEAILPLFPCIATVEDHLNPFRMGDGKPYAGSLQNFLHFCSSKRVSDSFEVY